MDRCYTLHVSYMSYTSSHNPTLKDGPPPNTEKACGTWNSNITNSKKKKKPYIIIKNFFL